MDDKIKSALDAAGTAADYSARATYQRGYDAGVIDAKNTISVCGECDDVKAREWALGVQVVAQAARLRLAEDLYQCLLGCHRCGCNHPACSRCRDDGDIRDALAAWDALGVQVVAQAARLRLAEDLYQCLLGCHRCGCQHPACSREAYSAQIRQDVAIARADAAETREWALGVQVVAQAARLKLATKTIDACRFVIVDSRVRVEGVTAALDALAAWDAVPGMEP